MKVIKRDGRKVDYEGGKIILAIEKSMKHGSGVYKPEVANLIEREINKVIETVKTLTIFQIEDMVFHKLIEKGEYETAKVYEGYRAVQEFKREHNTTDDSIMGLLDFSNKEVMSENSNKNAYIASTQRDLVAGEISKDIAKRKLIPSHLVQAHEDGKIHIHDLDYIIQPIFNCCLPDIEDMLKNGTIINGKMIEQPKSFQVACNVMTQIVAQIASNQYGGQSISSVDSILAPYVRISFNKYKEKVEDEFRLLKVDISREDIENIAWKRTEEEVRSGVQTIQYQINTLMTTNGQAPFLTLLLHFEPDYEYAYEAALIQEEILKQRIQGIKNEVRVWVTPAFPKLIYVLDEHNIHTNSKYYYLTELASECTAKRMYPDYISAKKMREMYQGNIFAPMGW